MSYFVYILSCSDNSLYTGITTDLDRRLEEHNSSKLGAKYTRGRRPVKIVYYKKFRNRVTASREEARIKKMTREEKLEIVKTWIPGQARNDNAKMQRFLPSQE